MNEDISLWAKMRERVRACSGHRGKEETMELRQNMANDISQRYSKEEIAIRLASFYQAILDSEEGYRSVARGSNEKIQLGSEALDELVSMIGLKTFDVKTEEEKLKALKEYHDEFYGETYEIAADDNGVCFVREKVI